MELEFEEVSGENMGERSLSAIIDERNSLLHELSTELDIFGRLTHQSLSTEIDSLTSQAGFWENCDQIATTIDSIFDQIHDIKEDALNSQPVNDDKFNELKEENLVLQEDLKNAKILSRSIISKSSVIRNQRVVPILSLLWSLSTRSANSHMISECQGIFDVLFQYIENADNNETNVATLGLLVNISSSTYGRQMLIAASQRSPIPFIKKILTNEDLLMTSQAKQQILYLIRNIAFDNDICIELIRDGCLKFCAENFSEFEHEYQYLAQILEALINNKYIKTLTYYAQNDLAALYEELKNMTNPDLKMIAIIRDIANVEYIQQSQMSIKRFGVKRIYS